MKEQEDAETEIELVREISELRQVVQFLQGKCCEARCNMILQPSGWTGLGNCSSSPFVELEVAIRSLPNILPVRSEEEPTSLTIRNRQLEEERDQLQTKISAITEENSDVYETLRSMTVQKEDLRTQLQELEEELDTCNSVAHFLEQERNRLKQEIERHDELLEQYRGVYSSAFR